MRLAILIALVVALVSSAAAEGSLRIVRTWPGYRTADSFKRVSEYFSGKENTGGQIYLRSQPDSRAGFYFLTRTRNSENAIQGARLQLSVITQHSPTPTAYTYTVEIPKGDQVYQIGLTGKDWPNAEEHPVAWQIVISDAAGSVLVSDQSFLWGNEPQK